MDEIRTRSELENIFANGQSGGITAQDVRDFLKSLDLTIEVDTKLATGLAGKANASHTHPISDVTSLQTSLDGKAATSHSHSIADTSGLQSALDALSPLSHTHSLSDVTGLQNALDDKADTADLAVYLTAFEASGTYSSIAAVNNLTTTVSGKLTAASNLSDLPSVATARTNLGLGTAALAAAGDFATASHTHSIANVAGLQTALDGKATASHAHSAADITSGSLADARLSSNIPLKNAANTFTQNLQINNAIFLDTSGTISATGITATGSTLMLNSNSQCTGTFTATTFSGSGASLTSLPAASLTGSIADARLSSNVPLKNAANTFSAAQSVGANLVLTTSGTAGVGTTGKIILNGTSTGYGPYNQEISNTITGNTSLLQFYLNPTNGNSGQGSNRVRFYGENTNLEVVNMNDGAGFRFGYTWSTGYLGICLANGAFINQLAMTYGGKIGTCAHINYNGPPTWQNILDDGTGKMGIGTDTPSTLLDINSDNLRLRTAKTPASAAATGTAGTICWDSSYVYVCTATNTWKRSALSTW